MKKKLLSLAVVTAMCMSMAQGVYASVGYNTDVEVDDYSSSSTTTTTTTTTTNTSVADAIVNTPVVSVPGVVSFSENKTVEAVVTADLVANTVTTALAQAATSNTSTAVVTLQNADVITSEALTTIANAAVSSGKTATVSVEKVVGGQVVASVKLDPVVAAALGTSIKLNVETDSPSTRGVFNTFFENELAIASFDQPKSFGMEIETSIKLDLSKLDTSKELQFCSYNPDSNTFVRFTPEYTITPDGFISFKSSLASDVLISDSALQVKGA